MTKNWLVKRYLVVILLGVCLGVYSLIGVLGVQAETAIGPLPTDYVIAASDSTASDKALADSVCGTNDAGEIITAALAAHPDVYLMDGTYESPVVGSAIVKVTSAGRSLRGASKAGTIIRMADGQASGHGIYTTAAAAGLAVSDLTLDGNKANQTNASCTPHGACGLYMGVYAQGNGHQFRNLIVKDFVREGIFCTTGSGILISGCEIYGVGFAGIDFWNVTNSIVENCDSHSNCWGVMTGPGCADIIIRDNKLHDNTPEHGTYLQGDRLQITGNQVYNNAAHGIRLSNANDIVIDGNECWNNRNNIIIAAYSGGQCTNVVITNNVCRNAGWTNCQLWGDTSGCLVEGNVFDTCAPSYGCIWLAEDSNGTPPMYNTIRNNDISNCAIGIKEGYGSYTSPDYNSYLYNTFTNVATPYALKGTHNTVEYAAQPDVNVDGSINVLDMIRVGQHWNETGAAGWIPEDVYKDGTINVLDATLVGQGWSG